ncbi:MAG TPA: enoyl-CoA hydratase-related protein [Chloroflexia bacterium]|nr:enoyl-CoA hydratase-related protein [Chloroflexia bacterium]
MTTYDLLTKIHEGRVCRITLNRPEVHNAFNAQLIAELRSAFEDIAAQVQAGDVRAVVLAGAGKSFSAGADVNWMRESLAYSEEENRADARRMAEMLDSINSCPVPVIGRIHGAALGGGAGLAAVCDVVIAANGTSWAFSEVKLGIAPAVISPYVLAKIGRGHARALFLTGERFTTERAVQIGLAHFMVEPEELDVEVERVVKEILNSSPRAIMRAKELIAQVPALSPSDAMTVTVNTISALRTSSEGQEGLRAFLERRKPGWVE